MKRSFLFGLVVLALGLTSCKDDITFDQEGYDNMIKASFPVQNIDPDHDWATIGTATAAVTINLKAGETYKVKLYDANPVGVNEAVTLLQEGTVRNGETLKCTFSYKLASPSVFVGVFDSQNFMSIYHGTVQNGVLNMTLGGTTAARGRHRAIQPIFQFPGFAADSKFLNDVPAGVQSYEQVGQWGYGSGTSYIEDRTAAVNIWGNWDGQKSTGGTLYIKGNCNFSSSQFYVAPNTEIYLVKGATLTLGSGSAGNLQGGCNFYMAEGSKIVVTSGGELKLNNGLHIYNRGTIEAPKLSVNNTSVLYNKGTVTISGELSTENNNSVIVNDGTVTATRLHTAGSSHVQNNADMTINGNTDIDSNNNTWVNNGQYTTNNFFYTAGSCDVINNCHLTVNQHFKINLGDTDKNGFRMDSGAGVVTNTFEMAGPSYVFMGAQSVFEVKTTATMNCTKAEYGVYGPSAGSEAVFTAKDIVAGKANQGYLVTYGNNLLVASETHFAQGYSGSYPYYDTKGNVRLTTLAGANVSIASTECCQGFLSTEPEQEEPKTKQMSYRFCFEDNFPEAGDYDFNDCVLTILPTISAEEPTKVTLSVTLNAVGANKCIAGALRLKGITNGMLNSKTRTQDFTPVAYPDKTNHLLPDGVFLTANDPNSQDYSSVVLALFKDAHWAMNSEGTSNTAVKRVFYNTMKYPDERGETVEPKTATFVFDFKNTEDAQRMLAESTYDAFIVSSYNGAPWEIHTVQNGNKGALVIHSNVHTEYQKYLDAYVNPQTSLSGKYTWAVLVPGDFRYPAEWQVIGERSSSGAIQGAYREAGHSFVEWAEDMDKAKDWYNYPYEEMVY